MVHGLPKPSDEVLKRDVTEFGVTLDGFIMNRVQRLQVAQTIFADITSAPRCSTVAETASAHYRGAHLGHVSELPFVVLLPEPFHVF